MRIAVVADIHGNLPALEAVMADVRAQAPDAIVCAGDLALRGPFPAECVDLLFDSCSHVLLGNTDSYLAGHYLGNSYRTQEAWKAELLTWTRGQLGDARLSRVRQLGFSARLSPKVGEDLFVCHANPRNLEDSLEPTLSEAAVLRYLSDVDARAVAVGHLHFPYQRRVNGILLADVASVGVPRDGDRRASYGLFHYSGNGWTVDLRRVEYDVASTETAFAQRSVPGATELLTKLKEARYRHHRSLSDARARLSSPERRPASPPADETAERTTTPPNQPGIAPESPREAAAATEIGDPGELASE